MATPQSVVDDRTAAPTAGDFNLVPGDDASSQLPDASETEQSVQDNPAEREAQAEASQHGWVNKDSWVAEGKDPSRWKPASEFLDVRHNVLSIVKGENQSLRAQLAALKAKQDLREKAENEARVRLTGDSLQEELRRAHEERDDAKIAEVTRKIAEHSVEVKTTEKTQAAPQPDPELQQTFVAFVNANPIIKNDIDVRTDFMLELKRIAEVAPQMDMDTALAQAKRRVIRDNPAKFRGNGTRVPGMVETGGTGSGLGASSGKGWNDLLPEVQRRAEDDIRAKKYTKEEFLAVCDADHFRR